MSKRRPTSGRRRIVGGAAALALVTLLVLTVVAPRAQAELSRPSDSRTPRHTTSATYVPLVPSASVAAVNGATRYEETSSLISFSGFWRSSSHSSYSGGSLEVAGRSGSTVTISFRGTSLTWIATTGSTYGKALVTVDKKAAIWVDLYSSQTRYQQPVYTTGLLADGSHTVSVAWTGQKNSAARNYNLNLDAVDVVTPTAATTVAPTTSTTVRLTTTTQAATLVFNVLDYGAKADGRTDDAPAVQAAVNAARDAGGGTVYMPPGTYKFNQDQLVDGDLGASVELFDGVTIMGAGPDKTFVVAARIGASGFGAIRRDSISVQNMDITSGGSDQDGIKFGVSTNVLVQNVTVHDMYIGIAFYSCVNPVARGIKLYNTTLKIGPGATWPEHAVGGLIEDSEAWGTNLPSFRIDGQHGQYGSDTYRISGVVFRNVTSNSNGSLVDYIITYADNLVMEDSVITGTHTYPWIYLAGVNGALLTRSAPAYIANAQRDPEAYGQWGPSSNIVVE